LAVVAVSGQAALVFATIWATFPQLQFAYYGASVHVALETAASLIALLAGFLVFGRLRRRGSWNDLLLACALAVLVLLNLCLLTMSGLAQLASTTVIVWILLIGRSLCSVLFALSAFVPRRRVLRPGPVLTASVAGGAAVVLLIAVMLDGLAGPEAHRLAAELALGGPTRPGFGGHPGLLTLQLATAALYGTAAVGFFRRARRNGDEFFGWLAIAGVLAALSHLNYSLYPSLYSSLIHVGDIFRLCSYLALLTASMREISSYWHELSEVAVGQERQRIARELHDGLAQELACLARNLDSLDSERGGETLSRMRGAVHRARLESRRVVSTLSEPGAELVEVALAQAAAEVADRFHIGLQLDLASGIKVSAAQTDALVRIAREAVTNAARHSGVSQVRLALEGDGSRVRLRVSDRGRGFDPAATDGGFGLVFMRQRARAVGGELRISSAPGEGSEVEATM
jgi:signal transduction histidine kinase